MVNESDDKMEGQEEGEYHFSDDQINYEMETELPKTAAPVTPKANVLAKLTPYRRMIIGGIAFLAIIFIVYKVLMPSSTQKTQIAQAPSPVAQQPVKTGVQPISGIPAQTQAAVQAPSVTPAATSFTPSTPAPVQAQSFAPPAKTGVETPTQQATAVTPETSTAPAPQAAANVPQPEALMPPMPQSPVAMQQQNVPAMPSAPPSSAPATAPAVVIAQESVPPPMPGAAPIVNGTIPERISALEDQNAKLVRMIQAEYAQKLAEYEAQNTALQAKINELNKRFMSVEASLGRMAQMLQVVAKSPMGRMVPSARPEVPRIAYSVQAIIPGRAWLKSDSGDTVTVAEGDMLKNYGRVTKIDPYDGIVDIDTGAKIVSLSYGLNGE